MPVPMLKNIADKASVSMSTAEKEWDNAKKIVADQYDYSKTDDKYWSLVTAITKKKLGLSESLPVALQASIDFDYMVTYLIEEGVLEEGLMILEGTDGLTYYEMRQFMAYLLKHTSNKDTKSVLDDLLKTLGKLEMLSKPVPVIRKIKSVSPAIF